MAIGVAALELLVAPAQAQVHYSGSGGPLTNVPRTPAMDAACSAAASAARCQDLVIEAIDHARQAEGVGPLVLPARYATLTTPRQLLVLADLERVSRGLPAFVGLSRPLDELAETGALTKSDPDGWPGTSWGSNWAGGEGSALLADYDWMYDDGAGSPNLLCGHPSSAGCWAHRRNILGDYGPQPSMGAAEAVVGGVTSITELFSSSSAAAAKESSA
jgi:hypothetical protein